VRKQRSDEVHAAREDALAARNTQYDSERIGLKSQHERETKEGRVEPATLRAEAAAEWTSYAEEHNLPEQKKPDWMERLQEEDAALLQATAEQKLIKPAPEKPAEAPPLHAWLLLGSGVVRLKARFGSHGAGSRLRFGWTARWSMRRIMARVTIASDTSGRCS